MGTRLIAAGLDLATDDPCLWNQSHPAAIRELHQRDVAAGAEAIFTNSFGANRSWLARFGSEAAVDAINSQAARLAREAAGPDRFVVGSIGPTAAVDEATLWGQVIALIEAGVDALALETFSFPGALEALGLLKGNRPNLTVPILVGLCAWPDAIATTADQLTAAGAAVVGANCFADVGLAHRLIDVLSRQCPCRFWLKPSTGWPVAGTLTLADFAELAASIHTLRQGALGGCCGTSDRHLRTIQEAWRR